MRLFRRRARVRAAASLGAVLAAWLLVPAHAAAPAWLRLDTPNFTIVGSARERDLQAVAAEFERFREALAQLLNVRAPDTVVPTVVIVFDSDRAFEPFRPLYRGKSVEVEGMFVGSTDVNYIGLSGRRDVRPILHEYAHLVIDNVMPDLPAWLGEGLAEYYSTVELEEGRKAVVGRPIEPHVVMLQRSRLLTLDELLAVRHDSPLYNEGARRTLFYAQSWALVHYLLRGAPPREERLIRYARTVGAGADAREAWHAAFGQEPVEAGLRDYIHRGRFSMVRATLPERIQAAAAVARPVSDAEVEAFLGDLLWRQDREEEAAARLEAAARRPDGTRARAALARLRADQNALVEARALLSIAPAAPGDWLEDYAVGVAAGAAFELVRPSPEAAAESAFGRAALGRALAARPNLAHGWYVLAGLALLSEAELDTALAAIERAMTLAPSRLQYPARRADVLMRRRDYAAARPILEGLLANPRAASLHAAIRTRLQFLAAAERAAAATPDVEPPRDGTDRIYTLDLREVRPGEARAAGVLTRVDCGPDGLTLHVRIKGQTSRFRAGRFQEVQFVTYREELHGDIACGPRRPEDLIYITWTIASASPGEVPATATAVAVEFLPKEYRLKR